MVLTHKDASSLLKKYQIPLIKTKKVSNWEEVLNIANKWGFPLALKIDSPKILHKTDIGGVITNIQGKKELKVAWQKLQKIAKKYKGEVIVQPNVKGLEVIIGAKKDPVFGGVVMFGIGGIFVEVFKDVSFRIAPISKKEAKKMIKEIKGYPILKGYRGQNPVNIDKLTEILVSVSKLIQKEKNIQEIDLNPVIVDQKRALVVDAKILTNQTHYETRPR